MNMNPNLIFSNNWLLYIDLLRRRVKLVFLMCWVPLVGINLVLSSWEKGENIQIVFI